MGGQGGRRFALTHRTAYRFDRPVGVAPHEIRLRPAPHAQARVAAYTLTVEPAAHTLHWQQDAYANWVARLTFPGPAHALVLNVELTGELLDVNPFDFFVEVDAATFPFGYTPAVAWALQAYAAPRGRRGGPEQAATSNTHDAGGDRVHAWIEAFRASVEPDEPTVALLVRLNRQLRADVAYSVRDEAGVQSAEATLAAGIGSCRDSAWLLVVVLRALGIAARFVSGYLIELAEAPGTRDAGSLHAWTEAFVPGAGWIGLDPTSGVLAGSGHLPLACAADPQMAAAVTGTTEICSVAFDATIDVRRTALPALDADARATAKDH